MTLPVRPLLAAVVLTCCLWCGPVLAAEGDPDATFWSDGTVFFGGSGSYYAHGLVTAPDGRLVVVGTYDPPGGGSDTMWFWKAVGDGSSSTSDDLLLHSAGRRDLGRCQRRHVEPRGAAARRRFGRLRRRPPGGGPLRLSRLHPGRRVRRRWLLDARRARRRRIRDGDRGQPVHRQDRPGRRVGLRQRAHRRRRRALRLRSARRGLLRQRLAQSRPFRSAVRRHRGWDHLRRRRPGDRRRHLRLRRQRRERRLVRRRAHRCRRARHRLLGQRVRGRRFRSRRRRRRQALRPGAGSQHRRSSCSPDRSRPMSPNGDWGSPASSPMARSIRRSPATARSTSRSAASPSPGRTSPWTVSAGSSSPATSGLPRE